MEKKVKKFKKPTRVAFTYKEDNILCYGIAYKKNIVCSCCGEVFKLKEVNIVKCLEWIGFQEAIK